MNGQGDGDEQKRVIHEKLMKIDHLSRKTVDSYQKRVDFLLEQWVRVDWKSQKLVLGQVLGEYDRMFWELQNKVVVSFCRKYLH